jgi:hypothetical protein
MKLSPTRIVYLAGAGAAALAFALPAAGQRERSPESLLPPGFGEQPPSPRETPPPPPPPASSSTPGQPSTPEVPSTAPNVQTITPGVPLIEDAAQQDLDGLAAQTPPEPIEVPETSRRPANFAGPLTPANRGLGANAFGNVNGVFLSALMRRLDAPLPSRWTSMLLRRALLSQVPTPYYVQDVDWIAERAWLLVRMGEADGARALVQWIPVDQYTPRMFTVAVQTALATADPAALCPLVEPGQAVSDEPIWPLAAAMCAALSGDSGRASELIDQARGRSGTGGIDLLLAQKVVGAGQNTRRAVSIQWEGVDSLNSWRFGLASATGLDIPDRLIDGTGLQVRAWQARAPMIPLEKRIKAAEAAATIGVFSNASLVEIYSLLGDQTDPSEIEDSPAGKLRRAYIAPTTADRISAMRSLWDQRKDPVGRYAGSILTAAAAARISPSADYHDRAGDLIASMLSAGFDRQASRWGSVVDGMGNDGDRAWALLATGSARPSVDVSAGRVEAFFKRAEGARGKMLVAALAGLGRFSDPASLGVDPIAHTRWAAMIRSAARNHEPGTVVLLAAVGMQTGGWAGVPPEHLYQIISALRQVGLEYEARMIAAEAMSRL